MMLEFFGYGILFLMVIFNAISFFSPQRNFDYIYNKTAKDVNFNRRGK